jgi:hypothetical protein
MLSGTALEWLGLDKKRFESAASRAHSEHIRQRVR